MDVITGIVISVLEYTVYCTVQKKIKMKIGVFF